MKTKLKRVFVRVVDATRAKGYRCVLYTQERQKYNGVEYFEHKRVGA